MKRASIALLVFATSTACSRVEKCELFFRAAPGEVVDAAKLDATCAALRKRLAPNNEVLMGEVVVAGEESIAVRLVREPKGAALDQLKRRIEHAGRLRFLIVAGAGIAGFDEVQEQQRLDAWRAAHPGANVELFNQLARESGGPLPSIEWHLERASGSPTPLETALACERPANPASTFTTADLRVYPSTDDSGSPAIGFEMLERRRADFTAFTTRCLKRRLAIVYDGEVITAPSVNSPLIGSAIIAGHFTVAERDEMIAILQSGELPLALEFVELRKLP